MREVFNIRLLELRDGTTLVSLQPDYPCKLPAEVFHTFGGRESISGCCIFQDRVKACAVADWLIENGWELGTGREYLVLPG